MRTESSIQKNNTQDDSPSLENTKETKIIVENVPEPNSGSLSESVQLQVETVKEDEEFDTISLESVPSDNTLEEFYSSLLTEMSGEDNNSPSSVLINIMSIIASGFIILPGVGLTIEDANLPSGWPRYAFFATASGGLNFLQALAVTKAAFNHYANLSGSIFSTLRGKCLSKNREQSENLENMEISNSQNNTSLEIKNILYACFKEVITHAMLLYMSEQLPTLASDVSWLKPIPRQVFWALNMISMQSSIFDLLTKLSTTPPALTNRGIVEEEIKKIRNFFSRYLTNTSRFVQDNHDLNFIEEVSTPEGFLRLFESDPSCTKPNSLYWNGMLTIAKAGLLLCYISANIGSYQKIYTTNEIALSKRLGSIGGDIAFGFVMTGIAERVISALYNRIFILFRYEWRKMLIGLLGIAAAGLTVGSTLEVNKEANIPVLAGLYLAALGVIFDNSVYPILCGINWENRRTYAARNRDTRRYQRAAISIYYDALITKLENLSDKHFLLLLKDAYSKRPDLFNSLLQDIQKECPWAKSLNFLEILNTLTKENIVEAMQVIDRSGHFGLQRKGIEAIVSAFSFLIATLKFFPQSHSIVSYLFQLSPVVSVPVGIGVISLFKKGPQQNCTERTPLLSNQLHDTSNQVHDISKKDDQNWKTIANSFCKLCILSAFPLAVGEATKNMLFFGLTTIFGAKPEDINENVEIAANTVSALTSAYVVNRVGKYMR